MSLVNSICDFPFPHMSSLFWHTKVCAHQKPVVVWSRIVNCAVPRYLKEQDRRTLCMWRLAAKHWDIQPDTAGINGTPCATLQVKPPQHMENLCWCKEFYAPRSGHPAFWRHQEEGWSARNEEKQWHPCVIPSTILAAFGQQVSVTEREICFSEQPSACVGALGPVLYAFVTTTIMPREEEGYKDQEHEIKQQLTQKI